MDHEDLLTDLQVLAVLLGLLAHLGLRAYLDLLGQKVKMVLQGLQVLTASLAPKDLLDFLGHLVNQLSLFRRCRVCQDPVEIQASRALDTRASQEPSVQQEMDQLLDLVDLPAPVASMDWQDLQDLSALPVWMVKAQSGLPALQDPVEALDQLDQVLTPLALQALLAKGLSGLQVLEEILAQPGLLGMLVHPGLLGLQVPMDIVS